MRLVDDGETAKAEQDVAAQEARLTALALAVEYCHGDERATAAVTVAVAERFRKYIETGELPE